jgi:hypothetical protein
MNLDGGLASIVTDRNREEARDPETPFSAFRTDMLYTVFGKLFQGQFSATTVSSSTEVVGLCLPALGKRTGYSRNLTACDAPVLCKLSIIGRYM